MDILELNDICLGQNGLKLGIRCESVKWNEYLLHNRRFEGTAYVLSQQLVPARILLTLSIVSV